jgi:hypothetical protein
MRKFSALLLLAWLMPTVAAENLQCIQQPKRNKPCPHLLYRVAQLPDTTSAALICICVTDFAPLLLKPSNDAEQVQLNMTKRQMEVTHGAKLQSVLEILQHRN